MVVFFIVLPNIPDILDKFLKNQQNGLLHEYMNLRLFVINSAIHTIEKTLKFIYGLQNFPSEIKINFLLRNSEHEYNMNSR